MVGAVLSISSLTYATRDFYSSNVPKDACPTKGYKEMMERVEKEENERKEKGYLEQPSSKYEFLSTIENKIKYTSFKSTHLHKTISDLKIAPSLKHVPSSLKDENFGYGEAGSFNKDNGWNGITEIFKSKSLDVCQFTHLDLQLSGGGYSLPDEDERLDVNGKYTIVQVTGQKKQGFDYQIDWVDNLNWYTLTCVNKKFSNELTQSYIDLAKAIDTSF